VPRADAVIDLLCPASVALIILWLFFFAKSSVRNTAFTYAETLLRACDAL
jgi:hypothetical protein